MGWDLKMGGGEVRRRRFAMDHGSRRRRFQSVFPFYVSRDVLLNHCRAFARKKRETIRACRLSLLKMDRRGEVATLDEQIKLLMSREKLPEADVKALCDKV